MSFPTEPLVATKSCYRRTVQRLSREIGQNLAAPSTLPRRCGKTCDTLEWLTMTTRLWERTASLSKHFLASLKALTLSGHCGPEGCRCGTTWGRTTPRRSRPEHEVDPGLVTAPRIVPVGR